MKLLKQLEPMTGYQPDPWQQDLIENSYRRFILNCSRQSGKTHTTGAIGACMALGRPGSLTLVISGQMDRQGRNAFLRVIHPIRLCKVGMSEDTRYTATLETGSHIAVLAADADTVRSYSAPDMIIVDEASRVSEDVFQAIEPMMSTNPDCIYALMSTPNGKQGTFYNTWVSNNDENIDRWQEIDDGWHRVQVSWNECPRITRDWVAGQRTRWGGRYVAQEYECRFVEAEDQLFRNADIESMFGEEVHTIDEDGLQLVGGEINGIPGL